MAKPRLSTALVICASLSACAGEQAMRDTASISAQILNDMKTETSRFIEQQNRLNRANAQRLQSMRQERIAMESRARSRLAAWEAADDKDAVAMRKALIGTSSEELLAKSAALTTLQPLAVSQLAKLDASQFDALVKQLVDLSAEASLAERVGFLTDYGQAVASAYQESMEAATKDAAATNGPGSSANEDLASLVPEGGTSPSTPTQ